MANWQNFTEFGGARSLYVNMDAVVAVAGLDDGGGSRIYFSMGADKNYVRVSETAPEIIAQSEKAKKPATTMRAKTTSSRAKATSTAKK